MSTVPATHSFPRIFRVRQEFERTRVDDFRSAVKAACAAQPMAQVIRPGQRVAVAVGSRGIANLAAIVRALVDELKALGSQPFIIPAMGSHGGGTAEGQAGVLARYGVTAEAMGCAIESQMETEVIATSPEGIPVHIDRLALAADHVVLVNRVKPHTRFVGPTESGLMKMMLIGLGKHAGATVYHQAIQTLSFPQIIASVAAQVLQRCPVRFGLAIIENAYDETAQIELVPADVIATREPDLLKIAEAWLPRLPFDRADLLIVDRIGKDVSGAGMDTNVVGRKFNDHVAAPHETPKIHHIFVRGLTKATHGNATGIGIAEFCRSCVVEQMDRETTWINCLTGGHATAGMIPMHWPTDLQVLRAAAGQSGLTPAPQARWMWIQDTLHVAELMCSEAYWSQAQTNPRLTILSEPAPLEFDASGQLHEAFGAELH